VTPAGLDLQGLRLLALFNYCSKIGHFASNFGEKQSFSGRKICASKIGLIFEKLVSKCMVSKAWDPWHFLKVLYGKSGPRHQLRTLRRNAGSIMK